MLLLRNRTNTEFKEIIYIACSEKIKSYTGDKNYFFGDGNLSNPEALKKVSLNNENSLGKEPIIAAQIEVELEAYQTKQISFMIGGQDTLIDAQDKAYKYRKIRS